MRLFHLVSLFLPKIKSMGGLSVLYGVLAIGNWILAIGNWVWASGEKEKIGKGTTRNWQNLSVWKKILKKVHFYGIFEGWGIFRFFIWESCSTFAVDLDEKPTPKGEKSKLSKPVKAIFDMVEKIC